MRNIAAYIVIILMLSGCAKFSALHEVFKPWPHGLSKTPEGTPEFQAGWTDGCESGLSVYGNDVYKAFYTFKQDVQLVDHPEYYRAWKDSYTYCRWYVWNWARPWQQ